MIFNILGTIMKLSESVNIQMLRKLVLDNVNIEEDYIIPADADEFQEFPDSLENIIKIMNEEDSSFIDDFTKERVSETGEIIKIEK